MVIGENEILWELESGTIGYADSAYLVGDIITVRFQDENGNEITETGVAFFEL